MKKYIARGILILFVCLLFGIMIYGIGQQMGHLKAWTSIISSLVCVVIIIWAINNSE